MSTNLPAPAPSVPVPHIPPPDDREPKTRRRLHFFDRAKVLVIIAVVLAFAVAKRHADIPVMKLGDVITEQLRAKQWLLWVAAVEVVRQIHYLFSESAPRYHGLWTRNVWGRWNRRMTKLNPWFRFRMARLFRVGVMVAIVAFILAFLWHESPVQALVAAPARLWHNAFTTMTGLPAIIYVGFIVSLSIVQFAAIFWFMSRGGVDTYMPNEVKTRFADVWGQDRVLAKVQENILFLDKPQLIEERGGHVPGGILLWGPPGTGKTLMAEAVAGETGRPYVFVDPGAFQNMFFGVGILKVKSLFRKLRKLALRFGGVIVFFDEADSLGSRRGGVGATGGFGGTGGGLSRFSFEAPYICNGLHYVSADTATEVTAALRSDALRHPRPEPPSGIRGIVATPMMGGGGGMGTLQALLTELSGLTKPRGFLSRRVRAFLTLPPKAPPKYRLLVMMATNMPEALDEALLRPGRIDRIYKVDFPTLEGRKRTFEGYLNKVRHQVSPDQLERLALMSPRASGAVIKDVVNEALIIAMRNGRDTVIWQDLLEAKQLKTHGIPDDVHPMALERHAVAIHEACHAVAVHRLKRREVIDIATIEPRGGVGGFVSPVPLEEPGFAWRRWREDDVVTFLASLAGERHFYAGDNSVGVGADLAASTSIVMAMLGFAAMGKTLASLGVPGATDADAIRAVFGHQIEERLQEMLERAHELIVANRRFVLAIAHALERNKTISGEDVQAIFSGGPGLVLDGSWYHTEDFIEKYEEYHAAALEAHCAQGKLTLKLPAPPEPVSMLVGAPPPTTPIAWNGAPPPPPPPPPNGQRP